MLDLSDGSREDGRHQRETDPHVKMVQRFDLPLDANVMADRLLMTPVSIKGICRGQGNVWEVVRSGKQGSSVGP